MRDEGFGSIRDIEGTPPEVLQARDRGLEDEPRLRQERERRQRRTRPQDVEAAVGMCEGQQASEAQEASRLRSGLAQVRRMKKMIPVRGLNPALGRMIRRMK